MNDPHYKPSTRTISVFTLIMINVIAIDSLRNVPAAAEYGFSLVFYYVIAAVCFFIPSAFVSAELATGWPKTGGVYVWIREAFGPDWGFIAIWLQWIENVIWYPTLVSFMAATTLYTIDPALPSHKFYLLSLMLGFFWIATILNLFGMKISGWFSDITAILGTLIPMIFIIGLGYYWLHQGHSSQIEFSLDRLIPDLTESKHLTYLTGIILSLVGIELSATHAQDVKHPQRDYPRAMLVSVFIIILTMILSSLAVAVVVPKGEIQLVDGLVQAFDMFFKSYHLSWMTYIIGTVIVIGGFGTLAAWIIGPSRGLLIASEDRNLPTYFHKTNQYEAPSRLLIGQALIFTLLCLLFVFMPSVNSSYWILVALATQLYVLMYLLMFIAGIYMRYQFPNQTRSFRIPFGNVGMWIVGGIGALSSLAIFAIGFLPPDGFEFGSITLYEVLLSTGLIFFMIPPSISIWWNRRKEH